VNARTVPFKFPEQRATQNRLHRIRSPQFVELAAISNPLAAQAFEGVTASPEFAIAAADMFGTFGRPRSAPGNQHEYPAGVVRCTETE
jgi:hypothetical protein